MGSKSKNYSAADCRPATQVVALCTFLLIAGCTGVERSALQAPPPMDTSAAKIVTTEPAPTAVIEPGEQSLAKTAAPVSKPLTSTTRASTPESAPVKKTTAAASPEKSPAEATLDLPLLEKRLRETGAIGVFTKIALKNQVDDLLNKFRAYYQGKARTTLADLRQPYDMLLLKVLSLLQDSDPALARSINSVIPRSNAPGSTSRLTTTNASRGKSKK